MNRRITAGLLVFVLCDVSVWDVSANGFRLASQDGFATARGEAFAATADNASAIYYNPAGITQLEGSHFRGGLYSIYIDPTYEPPTTALNAGQIYAIGRHYNFIPQAFLTYSFENFPVSVGVGVYAPYGGRTSWPQDTGFRSIALRSSLQYLRANPVIAFKLTRSLSIGGGVMVDYGKIDLEQGLNAFYQPPNVNFFRFKGDGWTVGYNLGALWQPTDQISIGATFRSTTTITMDGHTEFQQTPGFITYTRLPASADFTFPMTAVVGISYRPTPKWNMEFDADYTDWSCLGTITIHQQGTVPNGVKQTPSFVLNWQPSWIYEFGMTRYFDHGWHVSAGYAYDENSVPDAYYNPLVPDMDRHFFSVGTGYKGKRFDFDVAYQFGYGPARTVTGSTSSSQLTLPTTQTADGTYSFSSHAVLVTLGVRF